ncbi:MgtC/SapB family protein [Radiobacillus kanasensis]|uniref:MgtC/SapB family protein n=1 Tax=Radiobacillus kanasensis TaxID=2844358 RepID=UPI001E56D703|nr:MgtC/SapB family protein [Radiobacillus kanasensis]UFT99464.1 MgtC/SapB family protein [Radiobacillus kanasensis]
MEYLLHSNFLPMISKILIALTLSGAIGFERELKNQSAGFRTHILVGVGSCLMMLLSLYGFENFMDNSEKVRFGPARIPSYVISGIGFLGAGTIIVNGMNIRGLTTAASIWTVAGIGLVVGAGMYDIALFTTIIILLSLIFLNKFEKFFLKRKESQILQLVTDTNWSFVDLENALKEVKVTTRKLEWSRDKQNRLIVEMEIVWKKSFSKHKLYDILVGLEGIQEVRESYDFH